MWIMGDSRIKVMGFAYQHIKWLSTSDNFVAKKQARRPIIVDSIDWGGGDEKKWTFWTQKVDILNLISFNPPKKQTNKYFWSIFC